MTTTCQLEFAFGAIWEKPVGPQALCHCVSEITHTQRSVDDDPRLSLEYLCASCPASLCSICTDAAEVIKATIPLLFIVGVPCVLAQLKTEEFAGMGVTCKGRIVLALLLLLLSL